MTRIARVYGIGPKIGPLPYEQFATSPASVFFEASPIYQSIEISQRIWGTRTSTAFGPTVTQTIDQTETLTLTRTGLASVGASTPKQASPSWHPGALSDGGSYSLENGETFAATRFSVAAVDTTLADVGFLLNGDEIIEAGPATGPLLPSFFPRPGPGLPNPKQQRLWITGDVSDGFDYDFTETTTPPGTSATVTETYTLSPPAWGSSTTIPSNTRGSAFEWGYSAAESVDTSAWSATKWRDYRGTYVLPAQSMVVGIWTSGTMQRQITITLS